MQYTVGEMAKRLHVAPSTLRYYDKEGLLPFLERSSGGIRIFQDSDFEWLSIISCLKQTGMPRHPPSASRRLPLHQRGCRLTPM